MAEMLVVVEMEPEPPRMETQEQQVTLTAARLVTRPRGRAEGAELEQTTVAQVELAEQAVRTTAVQVPLGRLGQERVLVMWHLQMEIRVTTQVHQTEQEQHRAEQVTLVRQVHPVTPTQAYRATHRTR
jgi:hypothetical protein